MLQSLYTPTRYTNTKEVGKSKNTAFLMNWVNSKDLNALKNYYTDTNTFLATSTAGFTLSTADYSQYVVKKDLFTPQYGNLAIKPFLVEDVRPYTLAPVANAQIDQSVTLNLTFNSTLRVAFSANYPAAQVTVRLASDTAYTNTYSRTIVGSSVNVGTLANPMYITVDTKELNASWVVAGTPNPASIIRTRVIGVNQTATNRVTPLALYATSNATRLIGSPISLKLCCVESFNLKREMETADLKCGKSIVGNTVTEDKFTVEFEVMEESMDLLASSVGSVVETANRQVLEHLTGYEVGNESNKVETVTNPLWGQVQLPLNLNIASVSIECANLQRVDYNGVILSGANLTLGTGQYAYDNTTGIMYFNTNNSGKSPEIMIYSNKIVEVVAPVPSQQGDTVSTYIQTDGADGRIKGYFIKKAQFMFPEMENEDEGTKLGFEMTAFFAKKGDVEIYKF